MNFLLIGGILILGTWIGVALVLFKTPLLEDEDDK
ncbi:Methionine/alanine importer small subunit [Lacicoccus alkaliphilus]